MKYRARANGNVLDAVPASLVGVLYDEITEGVPTKPVPPPVRLEEQKKKRGRPRKVPK